ncbi:MAG TPA: CHASE4 domain-containing protein [Desulfatiglandales bacterium]|nr:CHASE4 domain-containing protein [Desulfatiglandales bacterium]
MTLKYKVGLILIVVFILSGLGNYAIQRFIIYPSFIALEREEAHKDLQRCVEAIKREVYHLSSLCRDWSSWNDTYDFIESRSENYIKSNLVLNTFTGNEINLIYIIDIDGRVVWGEIYNLETESTMELPGFPRDALQKTHPIISRMIGKGAASDIEISGVFMTEQWPLLIASRQILTSDSEGPVRGFLVMGRFLNDKIVKTLVEQTEVSFTIFPTKGNALPEAVREIPKRLTNGSPYLIEEKGHDNILIYTIYPDVKGRLSLLVQAKKLRNISHKGYVTMSYA